MRPIVEDLSSESQSAILENLPSIQMNYRKSCCADHARDSMVARCIDVLHVDDFFPKPESCFGMSPSHQKLSHIQFKGIQVRDLAMRIAILHHEKRIQRSSTLEFGLR